MTAYRTDRFDKELLQELACLSEGEEYEGYTVVENELCGNSRWAIDYSLVFKDPAGTLWGTSYARGATECQEEYPFEYEKNPVECFQMRAELVSKRVYVEVECDD